MKKYAETIMAVVITFIVSLILNTSLNYLTRDHGAVKFGPITKINTQSFIILDVENYENKPTDGFLLAIPTNLVATDIISSHPLDIKELSANIGSNQIKYVEISGVEPRTTIELLIPIDDERQRDLIRFTNLENLGYTVSFKEALKPPFQIILQDSIRIAIIY